MALPQLRALALTVIAVLFSSAVARFYQNRSRVNRVRKLGLPMPPWSWLFGHLSYFREYQQRYPSDLFAPVVVHKMCAEFRDTDMFYLDLWPFATAFLIVNDPNVAMQISSGKQVYEKPEMYQYMIDPLICGPNILTMNGEAWKKWRSVFNAAFAQGYLLQRVPAIIEKVEIFCQKLNDRVGHVFLLEDIATRLTVDIISKVAMDTNLNYQNAPSPLADSLRKVVSWSNFGNPFLHLHPIRPLALKYYGFVMDQCVKKALDARFREAKQDFSGGATKSKSVIALIMKDYLKQQTEQGLSSAALDPSFLEHATRQMRFFRFAGHDTTTSVLVYTCHMLYKHADVAQRVREEHAKIISPDPQDVRRRLKEEPALLNELSYTVAVIKETMRFYPPAGSERAGIPGVSILDRHGIEYPSEGFHVSTQHSGLHHHPGYWRDVEKFIPERWLVPEGHELHPPAGAFRAFEHGPRNCIGQNLAMLELRIVLALTVRSFDIAPAYEEWNTLKPKAWLEKLGLRPRKADMFDGERAYQIEKGAAHPKDGYPCKVIHLDQASDLRGI